MHDFFAPNFCQGAISCRVVLSRAGVLMNAVGYTFAVLLFAMRRLYTVHTALSTVVSPIVSKPDVKSMQVSAPKKAAFDPVSWVGASEARAGLWTWARDRNIKNIVFGSEVGKKAWRLVC